jgi:hypothetical protein
MPCSKSFEFAWPRMYKVTTVYKWQPSTSGDGLHYRGHPSRHEQTNRLSQLPWSFSAKPHLACPAIQVTVCKWQPSTSGDSSICNGLTYHGMQEDLLRSIVEAPIERSAAVLTTARTDQTNHSPRKPPQVQITL